MYVFNNCHAILKHSMIWDVIGLWQKLYYETSNLEKVVELLYMLLISSNEQLSVYRLTCILFCNIIEVFRMMICLTGCHKWNTFYYVPFFCFFKCVLFKQYTNVVFMALSGKQAKSSFRKTSNNCYYIIKDIIVQNKYYQRQKKYRVLFLKCYLYLVVEFHYSRENFSW